jgi:hypothetical protein
VVEVLEAQVRLYRREGKPVLTLVWDLYGTGLRFCGRSSPWRPAGRVRRLYARREML